MELQKTVEKLNQWIVPGILRFYQQDLIKENLWSWTTHMQMGRMILKSPLIPNIVFVTGEIGTAFKIDLFLKDEELVRINIDGLDKASHQIELAILAKKFREIESKQTEALTLHIGHPNFAHFLRDQLPALINMETYLAKKVEQGNLHIVITEYDQHVLKPFGGLERLLPSLSVLTVDGLPNRFPNRVFSVGSRVLSFEAHSRAKSQFIGDKSDNASKAKLVLSHRLDGRMPANIDELYIELATRWIIDMDGVVVLDGWNLTHKEARHDIVQRVEKHATYLNALGEACVEQIPVSKKSQFYTTSTMSFEESIQSMKDVVYQVSPWGTVHHKCAWVWNSNRLVILPPSEDLKFHQKNILNHFEGSKNISFLSESELLDESLGNETYPSIPYRILDVKRTSVHILARI